MHMLHRPKPYIYKARNTVIQSENSTKRACLSTGLILSDYITKEDKMMIILYLVWLVFCMGGQN